MNYATIKEYDIANGKGVRVSLFVSGCTHRCEECFNQEAWDFNYGQVFDINAKNKIYNILKYPYIQGLSVLGGDPLEKQNIEAICEFLKSVKTDFPTKDIWLYTGCIFENVQNLEIMKYIDVLVDGPYIKDKKNLMLPFRGSSNQRIIDVQKSLQNKCVCLFEC